jgi:hypothetical protein
MAALPLTADNLVAYAVSMGMPTRRMFVADFAGEVVHVVTSEVTVAVFCFPSVGLPWSSVTLVATGRERLSMGGPCIPAGTTVGEAMHGALEQSRALLVRHAANRATLYPGAAGGNDGTSQE